RAGAGTRQAPRPRAARAPRGQPAPLARTSTSDPEASGSRLDYPLAVNDTVLLGVDHRDVVARAAVDLVRLAVAGVDLVVARARQLDAVAHVEAVAAGATPQHVVAPPPDEDVVAAPSAQHVGAPAAAQDVVALRA